MYADIRDTKLYFERVGEGLPVLTMHGGLGLDHTWLRPWLDPLGAQAELIYYDHRGNGRSARPATFDGIEHATWVDDADALRAHLGHERVVVFGHSYGGYLALEYALRHPTRLAGVILCNTAPAFDYAEQAIGLAQARATPEQLAALLAAMTSPPTTDDALREVWRHILPIYFHRLDPAVGAGLVDGAVYSAAAFRHAFAVCLPQFDVTAQLDRIGAPTLVLGGRHDWITPPAQGPERLHRGVVGSELVLFEDCGHFPFVEAPDRFQTVVAQWLRQLR